MWIQFEVSVHHSIAEQAGLVTRDNIVVTLIPEPSTEAEIALEFVELSFVGQAMQRPEMWRFQDSQCSKCLYINQKVKTGVYCCHVNGEKHAYCSSTVVSLTSSKIKHVCLATKQRCDKFCILCQPWYETRKRFYLAS